MTDLESFQQRVKEKETSNSSSLVERIEEFPELKGIVYNFRDLSRATRNEDNYGDSILKRGRIFRSACLSRVTLGEEDSIKAISFLQDGLKIKTIIDFRSPDEIPEISTTEELVHKVWPTRTKLDHHHNLKRRIHVPLLSTRVKVQGLFWGSPWAAQFKTLSAVFSGNARNTFVKEVFNEVGLIGLNQKILNYSGPNIVKILRLISHSHNHPIMIHCSSGKDRTGLICALILACCGVDDKTIVENYHLSDQYLDPIRDIIIEENRHKGLCDTFDQTPRIVMEATLEYIGKTWGSIHKYLESIGFSWAEQELLVKVLTKSYD